MEGLLSLEELLSGVKGTVLGSCKNCDFTSVQTDSRNVCEKTMFVPLVGEFQNGHKYIPQAIEKGASVVLLNNEEFNENKEEWSENLKKYPSVLFIAVENTLHALQDAAETYVNKVCQNMIKVSITGSCGKTTTKELMVSVAKQHFGEEFVAYTKGNFNSETGLPLSVFKITGNEKIGIFEMGMNRENEIGEISKVFKSEYGIITNIGTAHIGILGSRENIAKEKRKSLAYISSKGAAFVPADDDFADYCVENVKGKVVKFGSSISENESKVRFIKDKGLLGTVFAVNGLEINLPICGMYNYQNALGVVACALELGITAEEIKKGFENFGFVSGRMEVRELNIDEKKVTVINDCYNANPDSMKKSVELCCDLEDFEKKIFVLGDMKELGAESEKAHKEIGDLLSSKNAETVYLVGPEMESAFEVYKADGLVEWFKDNTDKEFCEITDKIRKQIKGKTVILLKGSHSMNLNKILDLLNGEAE